LISQWGINNSLLQVDQEFSTSRVIASLNNNNEVSYEIVYPVAWDFIGENHDLDSNISSSTYLVYGSLASRNEITRNTLFNLLENSAIKVFDINLRPPFIETELLQQLLQKADIVKFNQAELEIVQTLFGGSLEDEASQAAFVINAFGVQTVIVTKGASGASCYTADTAYHSQGTAVEVNDTIGSGDAFLASFVAGLIHGDSPTENLKNAIAMGAFVATKEGGCPNYEQAEFRHFKEQQLYHQLS
jgi:fructokinase